MELFGADHIETESQGKGVWMGSLGGHQGRASFRQIRLCQASSREAQKISKDGDYATFLSNLCCCFTTTPDHAILKCYLQD